MAPVLVKRSAFQVKQWETFWLSETPHIQGSKDWGSVFPRTATWVDLIDLSSGRSMIFVNAHFDYEPSAIQESARFLMDWIRDGIGHHPLLLTGDFNTDKKSLPYQQLTSRTHPLKDVFRTGNIAQDDEGTFHGFGMEMHPQPIDWILVSDHFSVLNTDVDRYHKGNLFPSDHYPVTATLDWIVRTNG